MAFSKITCCSIFLMFISIFYIQLEAAVSRIPALDQVADIDPLQSKITLFWYAIMILIFKSVCDYKILSNFGILYVVIYKIIEL